MQPMHLEYAYRTVLSLKHALAALSLAAFVAGCVAGTVGPAGPPGDYGDAPDGTSTGYPGLFAQNGQFPTLASSSGANTQSINGARLGTTASPEIDANDPSDPDGTSNLAPSNTDSDDGPVRMVLQIVSIPPPAFMDLSLTVPNGGQGGQHFLNILIDLNMDGKWGGTVPPGNPEWVVQNLPFNLAAGQSLAYRTPYFAYGNGNRLPDPSWARIALTSEPAPGPDWDGSGTFGAGEIEDHLLRMPEDINGDPKTVVHMDCNPAIKRFAPGQNQQAFTCTLTNLTRVPGNVTYWLNRQTGGVSVNGGPNVAGNIALPAGPPVVLNLMATRGAMPSTWSYGASAVDPESRVDAKGIILGYGDSTGTITYVDDAKEHQQTDLRK